MVHEEELRPGGFRFLWDDMLFPPGTDSFLLSSLPRLKRGMRVCDLGCGTGLLSLLLLQREDTLQVTGVELQSAAAELARRSAVRNGITDRFSVVEGDLRQIRSLLPAGQFDLVICNPPYFPTDSGALSETASRRSARAETDCTLEEVCRAAAYLLRWGGSFCLVQRPERLTDLLCILRPLGLEPKRLRFVQMKDGTAPSLLLLESRRGGKPGLSTEAPLILRNSDGSDSAELDQIYFRTTEVTL